MNDEIKALRERLTKAVLEGESSVSDAGREYAEALGVGVDVLAVAEELGYDPYSEAEQYIDDRCEGDCGTLFDWIENDYAGDCQLSSTEKQEGVTNAKLV
jgi:hypothetical protein